MTLQIGKFYWIQAEYGSWPSGVQIARYDGTDAGGVQKWNRLASTPVVQSMAWIGDDIADPVNLPPPPPPPPPYTVGYDFGDCRDARGRTPVDPSIFQQARTMVIGFDGQSMMGNYAQVTPYVPTGEVYDLDVYSGNIYRCDGGPVLGSDGWPGRLSILPYLCDTLLQNGKALRILRVSVLKGGTNAYDWCPLNPLCTRRLTAIQALAAHGLSPNRWISVQGQGDLAGNPGQAINATNYRDLRHWGFQQLRAYGYAGTVMVGVGCHWTGFSDAQQAQSSAIRAGQAALATDNSVNVQPIALGPDDDVWVPDISYRVDGVHWADQGRYYAANAWAQAIPGV